MTVGLNFARSEAASEAGLFGCRVIITATEGFLWPRSITRMPGKAANFRIIKPFLSGFRSHRDQPPL